MKPACPVSCTFNGTSREETGGKKVFHLHDLGGPARSPEATAPDTSVFSP